MFLVFIDRNECDEDACSQMCVNMPGSFECVCFSGFQLQPDGRTCVGEFIDL